VVYPWGANLMAPSESLWGKACRCRGSSTCNASSKLRNREAQTRPGSCFLSKGERLETRRTARNHSKRVQKVPWEASLIALSDSTWKEDRRTGPETCRNTGTETRHSTGPGIMKIWGSFSTMSDYLNCHLKRFYFDLKSIDWASSVNNI
jgi:hypothetical protein